MREASGLDARRFALMIQMDRKYFAAVEAGKRSVGFDKLASIAGGLGITLSELLEGIENDDEEAGK